MKKSDIKRSLIDLLKSNPRGRRMKDLKKAFRGEKKYNLPHANFFGEAMGELIDDGVVEFNGLDNMWRMKK